MYRFALLEYFVQWSLALVPCSYEVHAGGDDDHECNERIHLNLAKKGRLFLVQSSSKYCGGKQCEAKPGTRFVKQLSHRCCSKIIMLTTTQLFIRRHLSRAEAFSLDFSALLRSALQRFALIHISEPTRLLSSS